jgi:hypothetical protein
MLVRCVEGATFCHSIVKLEKLSVGGPTAYIKEAVPGAVELSPTGYLGHTAP